MTPASPPRSTGFLEPALDGLRWFAVALVLIAHFIPRLADYRVWGTYGVNLFFVLSGFLITTILLRAKERLDAGTSGTLRELKRFHVRRIFRLWPVYYVVLALAFIANIEATRASIWWHVFFLSNEYIIHLGAWPGILSHLWTLAVEQQFYILWPLVVFWIPTRMLPWAIASLLVIGPLARGLLWAFTNQPPSIIMIHFPCCLDIFGAGAALAWLRVSPRGLARFQPVFLGAALVLLGWFLLAAGLNIGARLPDHWIIYDFTIQALGFGGLVALVLVRPTSRLTSFLRWAPWVYLGTISYSIYLLHNFMHRIAPGLLRHTLGFSYFSNEWAHFVYLSTLSLLTASLSYVLLEKPIRNLGHRLAP